MNFGVGVLQVRNGICIFYNIIKAINQFYHFDSQSDCSMIEDTDIFQVLTFEHDQFQEATNSIQTSLYLQKEKNRIPNREKDHNPAPLLLVHNEFEQQYHQPIRKKSLRAIVEDDQRQGSEKRQKEQLKEKSTFEDSKQINQTQATPVTQSMFNISYFCQRSAAGQQSPKKQLQNVSLKSDIVIKATPPKIQNKKNKVTVLQKEGRFYWSLNSEVEIDLEIIKNLYDELLEKECYVPIFAFQKFEEWNKAKSKSREILAETQKILKKFLISYTSFLNQHYSSQFHLILHRLMEARSLASLPLLAKKSSKDTKRYSQEVCQRKFDLGSLIEGLYQFIVTSKTEVLRKTVMSKIKSLAVTRKQCEALRLSDYSQNLYQKQEENWKVLAEIDFVLSLQSTENYCLKKMQAAKDRKWVQFWHKYLLEMRIFIKEAKKSQLLHFYI